MFEVHLQLSAHCQTLTLSSQPHVASCSATQHSIAHASPSPSKHTWESICDIPKPQLSKTAALDPAMLHTTSLKEAVITRGTVRHIMLLSASIMPNLQMKHPRLYLRGL